MLGKLSWPLIWCVNVFQGIGHVKKLEIHVYKDCQANEPTKEN
jgi:hypothetical protein